MEKMKFETEELSQKNIEKIEKLFPNCITEVKNENGELKKAINFETLKQMLSNYVVEDGEEHYEFTWVGKKKAMVEANKPIRKTLRPYKEESKDWDNTENLYIEGDNLEVLKLLQESYLNSIKMIYIDPPYNTGNDFIYNDDFKMTSDEYKDESGEIDEEGNRLFKNTDTNGRFHSDWCSMMYSRLMLARNLLSDDGVIFISIDDNEQENLKKICDEVFGEKNYLNNFAWINNITGRQIVGKGAAKTWENIYVYSKTEFMEQNFITDIKFAKEKMPDAYKGFNKDIRKDEIGEFAVGDTLYNHNRKFNEETRPNLVFSIYYNEITKEIITGDIGKKINGFIEIKPHKNRDKNHKYHAWRWSRKKIKEENYNLIVLPKTNGEYEIYTKIRNFNTTILKDLITNIKNGDREVQSLFDDKFFDYPKSIDLIKLLLNSNTKDKDIILDFFSGSATTAHAVIDLNAQDGGNRKFIMVQLPEETDEKSAANKAGYKNICEIGKERIRRAGEKIKEENLNKEGIDNLDVGFRVLKVDSTNMKDVYYSPSEYIQDNLFDLESNIKEDRTDLDLLFGCLIEWGIPLNRAYESKNIAGTKVHIYNDGDLIACFDDNISQEAIKEIAKLKPLRVVFRDSSFETSAQKINVEEIFKLLSPETSLRVI